MKKLFFSFLAVLLFFSGVTFYHNIAYSADVIKETSENDLTGEYKEGEVLVSFSPRVCETHNINDTCHKYRILGKYPNFIVSNSWVVDSDCHIILFSSKEYTTSEMLALLEAEESVSSVEPNFVFKKMESDNRTAASFVSNDPYVKHQWYHAGTSSISASPLWNKTTGKSPVVAVVDTGVNYLHEDLSANMWVNPYKAKGLLGTYGYDFGDYDNDPLDTDGHGTHIAGIIAGAVNNKLGIAGVSSNTKLMALKIFDYRGETSTSAILDAFQYIYSAQTFGTKVVAVNCSWGGNNISNIIQEMIAKIGSRGALFTFAAGNSSTRITADSLPCGTSSEYTVKVGASDLQMKACPFSNYSKTLVDLFAPGESILSTVAKNTFLPTIYDDSKRSQLTTFYDDVSSDSNFKNYSTAVCSNLNGSILSYGDGGNVSRLTSVDFLGKGGGCYQWDVIMPSNSTTTYLLYDITDLNLTPSATYYVSVISGIRDSVNTAIEWVHDQFVSKQGQSRFVSYGGRTYMKIVGLRSSSTNKNQTLYIDEVGISKGNLNPSDFGKYDFYSGTSMSTPLVSGAIALLADVYPRDTISQRKARLLTCVTKKTSLSDKCVTGGILSLNYSSQYKTPSVKSISISTSSERINVKKSIQLYAKISPADAAIRTVNWSVNTTAYAQISPTGKLTAKIKGAGKTVRVTAVSKAASSIKSSISIKINPQKMTSLSFKKKLLKLKVGKKKKLSYRVSPSYTSNKSLTWKSSNKRFATVSKKGVVVAKKAGVGKTVRIAIKAKDGSRKKATCKVKISA